MMKKSLIACNILIPIFSGIAFYYIYDRLGVIPRDLVLTRFVRNHLLDMLWSYALVFCIYYFSSSLTGNFVVPVLLAVVWSVVFEILQVFSVAKGTFDWLDIIFEIVAVVIAGLFIFYFSRRKENEKV